MRALGAAILIGLLTTPGCVIVQTEVANPIPGLSTVAVAPFFNLSQEAATDGRRFATAYFAELQKTPGFQVLPVGVTEQAILDNGLNMNDPGDALRLAEILGVDAVVVGAVTDYAPYYPPRIGLQVSWYSPREWMFYPGIPTDPQAGRKSKQAEPVRSRRWGKLWRGADDCPPTLCPVEDAPPSLGDPQSHEQVVRGQTPDLPADALMVLPPFDPLTPLMSYTRIFDGSDADLVAVLRDYVELSGDRRSGGWEAYLHRSEDYIRFTAHLMISEMLTLHGAEVKKRFVLKARKFR